MNRKYDPMEWVQEFDAFLKEDPVRPPERLTLAVNETVHRDLHPPLQTILAKLVSIHLIVGTISLLLCSQFGIGRGMLLEHAFMQLGEPACRAICGALFLGFTSFVASISLSSSELRKIRSLIYLPLPVLGIVSLGLFELLGAEIAMSLAIVWLIAGWIGGAIASEFGRHVRIYLERYV